MDPCWAACSKFRKGCASIAVGPLHAPQVDHFIPWARVPINAIENLVAADAACNHGKRDNLAAAEHVEAWSLRLRTRQGDLTQIARAASWEQGLQRTLGVARATYPRLPSSARLWRKVSRAPAPRRGGVREVTGPVADAGLSCR